MDRRRKWVPKRKRADRLFALVIFLAAIVVFKYREQTVYVMAHNSLGQTWCEPGRAVIWISTTGHKSEQEGHFTGLHEVVHANQCMRFGHIVFREKFAIPRENLDVEGEAVAAETYARVPSVRSCTTITGLRLQEDYPVYLNSWIPVDTILAVAKKWCQGIAGR